MEMPDPGLQQWDLSGSSSLFQPGEALAMSPRGLSKMTTKASEMEGSTQNVTLVS